MNICPSAAESAAEQLRVKQSELSQLKANLPQLEAAYLEDWVRLEKVSLEIAKVGSAASSATSALRRFYQRDASSHPPSVLTTLIAEKEMLLARMQEAPNLVAKIQALEAIVEERTAALARLRDRAERASVINAAAQLERENRLSAALAKTAAVEAEKHHRLLTLKAKVAAAESKARDLGSSVRRILQDQTHCPYCGEILGDRKHADHIYPLSKGGLSTVRNMVFACGPCNLKKRDMTLAAFIRSNNLDRAEIEMRLELLAKDF